MLKEIKINVIGQSRSYESTNAKGIITAGTKILVLISLVIIIYNLICTKDLYNIQEVKRNYDYSIRKMG